MPGLIYTASFAGVAATVQQGLFEFRAPTAVSCAIHGWMLTQETELADAAEEQLRLAVNRGSGTVTSGSGGTTATAAPQVRTAPAFGGTVEVNNTTKLAVGTGTLTTNIEVYSWNVRTPFLMLYTPELRPVVLGGEYWELDLDTTPADSITLNGTIWFEAFG